MIKELLQSNNLEDIILGIRMINKDNIEQLPWTKVEGDHTVGEKGIQLNFQSGHHAVVRTDFGDFFICHGFLGKNVTEETHFYHYYQKIYDFR